MKRQDHRAWAITGTGAVSAYGWGREALWQGLTSGKSAIRGPEGVDAFDRFHTEQHRTRIAAQVPPDSRSNQDSDFSPVDETAGRVHSLTESFALWATAEAIAQSGIPRNEFANASTGVFFGGSTAGMVESEAVLLDRLQRASLPSEEEGAGTSQPQPSSPFGAPLHALATQTINTPADSVARALGVRGPVETISSACASGTQALGVALDALRAGEIDRAIVGGADSLCQLTYAGFNSLRAVDPQACRPFRGDRAGMSLGEGAGVVILESRDSALAAGRRPLAFLSGVGSSCDAHHMTAPHPAGIGAATALQRALQDATVHLEEIDFINAHGTGTPLNDASEWLGVSAVFGEQAKELPLTATKASVGHLLGSSGAIEAVATVLCLLHGEIHGTPGPGDLDPDSPARLVREPRLALPRPRAALSTSFGFGGANAAAVFTAASSITDTPIAGRDSKAATSESSSTSDGQART